VKSIRTLVLAVIAAAPLLAQTPAPAAPALEEWTIDKAHSMATFRVRHMMAKVTGQFRDIDATVKMDRANPANSTVEFTMKAASIDTGQTTRDEHLRSPDFFEAAKYPNITFQSKTVKVVSPTQFEVTGDLTMHGVTRSITVPVEFMGFGRDPRGAEKAGFELQTMLDRKDYNITWNRVLDEGGLLLGDEVAINVSLQMGRKQAP
jgi:polyisoprenoid-binding protein YceI